MENQQQAPQLISLDDIANIAFEAGIEEKPKTEEDTNADLPVPPKVEDVIEPIEHIKVEDITSVPKVSLYTNKIKSLIEDGFLEDVSISFDGKEAFLSEIDIQDKDAYNSILEGIKEDKKKKRDEKYISRDGIDETTEKLIEIRKAGGDITDLIKENVTAIDQLVNLKSALDGYDMEDRDKEQLAINILSQDLQQKKLSKKVIQAQIEDFIESGTLEREASEIIDSHLSQHKEAIEHKKQSQLKKAEAEKENQKVFKKTLSNTYKEYQLPDNIQKVLVENATKLDDLKISNTDKLYFNAQEANPELYAKVNFLLNNPQEFEKWISGKKITEAKKEIIKSSIVINSNKKRETRGNNFNTLEDIAANQFNN
jgi:hypothetical protein